MNFQDLVDFFGSQVAAAQALGVTQPTLSNWKARGRIPHLQQLRIEHATKGKLRASSEILPEQVRITRRKVSRA
jgi:DNA-binding transcriptional regulator YdaS (Cro superfamily)